MQRWVFASIAKHLHEAADLESLPLIVEPLEIRTDAWKNASSKAEATLFGPSTREVSKDYHRVRCEVFCTVTTHHETDANAYLHLDFVGVLQSALDRCITVKDYGAAEPVSRFVLVARSQANDEIRVVHIRPTEGDQLFHSTIHARLEGEYFEG